MYRLNIILPWVLVLIVACFILFLREYVFVRAVIKESFEKGNRQALLDCVGDESLNWYQRSAALEYMFALKCDDSNSIIEKILSSPNINFRQALMKGCLRHSPDRLSPDLIDKLLLDNYSYIKYRAVKYVQSNGLQKRYVIRLQELRNDSSSMVASLATEILNEDSKTY